MRRLRYPVNGATERELVRFGGFREAAQLSHELERDARISSSVAGGLKLCSVLMFRHMCTPRGYDDLGNALYTNTIEPINTLTPPAKYATCTIELSSGPPGVIPRTPAIAAIRNPRVME